MNDRQVAKILIIEDEPSLTITLMDRLTSERFNVTAAANASEGLALLSDGGFDLLILDVMLPDQNGFDVCRDLRRDGVDIPILMLTARREVVDRVIGLKLGADDYLTKPFDMMELVARVEALLRRARTPVAESSGSYVFGQVRVDFGKASVIRDGEPLPLSPLDYKLLTYFIEHRGEALSRDRLLDEVWGYDAILNTRTVDVHVAGLRQKIEPNPEHPQFILTVHRVGYKFAG